MRARDSPACPISPYTMRAPTVKAGRSKRWHIPRNLKAGKVVVLHGGRMKPVLELIGRAQIKAIWESVEVLGPALVEIHQSLKEIPSLSKWPSGKQGLLPLHDLVQTQKFYLSQVSNHRGTRLM